MANPSVPKLPTSVHADFRYLVWCADCGGQMPLPEDSNPAEGFRCLACAGKARICPRKAARDSLRTQRAPLPALPAGRDLIIYTAGVFDGEGCITWLQRDHIRVQISQGAGNQGEHFCRMMREAWQMGKISRAAPRGNRLPMFTWYIDPVAQVRHFLAALRPYLIIKAETADEALLCLAARGYP